MFLFYIIYFEFILIIQIYIFYSKNKYILFISYRNYINFISLQIFNEWFILMWFFDSVKVISLGTVTKLAGDKFSLVLYALRRYISETAHLHMNELSYIGRLEEAILSAYRSIGILKAAHKDK